MASGEGKEIQRAGHLSMAEMMTLNIELDLGGKTFRKKVRSLIDAKRPNPTTTA
ncbi:MAG: hypothetical protein ABJJ53_19905 [Sulfitobacter sp.]